MKIGFLGDQVSNFINILPKAFTQVGPKSTKRQMTLLSFFAHLESAHVKAAHKTLMTLTPGLSIHQSTIYLYSSENVTEVMDLQRSARK
jgi:hypothetical protein